MPKQMYAADTRSDSQTSAQKFCPIVTKPTFFDNENGFTEAAIYQNGSLIPVCEVLPQWLQTFRSLFLK